MLANDVIVGLNKLIEMCARSLGIDSLEVETLEQDLFNLLHGIVPIEEYFWVEQMLGN